ncbi:MAG: MMPL family transporter [Candidatus Brocadiia bacterium]
MARKRRPAREAAMGRLSQWIVRHSLPVLLCGAGLTLFFALHLPRLELDPSAEGIMLEDDPARVDYERVKRVFGSDSIIVVAIHRPDTIFRTATLAKIRRMALELEALDGVERAHSLATSYNLADSPDGVQFGPLYTQAPESPQALAELRRQALQNHTFRDNLISDDARTAGIILFLESLHVDKSILRDSLEAALATDQPLPPALLRDLLRSPTFASELRQVLRPALFRHPRTGEEMALEEVLQREPMAMGRAAHRLLRENRGVRRRALREAPRRSRKHAARLVHQIEAVLQRYRDDREEDIYQVGNPVMKVRGAAHQRRDLAYLLPCTLAVVAVVLFLAFRSLRGVLVPLGTVGVSVVWTLGLMALLEVPLTVVTLIIGPLLIAVGNCYAMHLVTHYYQLAPGADEPRRLTAHALGSCFLPVLLAGGTTMVGFLSVTFSGLSSVREFGLFSAFGVLSALTTTVTLAPAALRWLPLPRQAPREPGQARSRRAGLCDRFLRAVGRLDARHASLVAVGGVGLCVAALLGCLFVEVNTNYTGFFHPDDPVRTHSRRMHEELSGAVPFYVVVDARALREQAADGEQWRGPFTRPRLLRFLAQLQGYMATLTLADEEGGTRAVDKTVSIADHVVLMHRSFMGDPRLGLPARRETIEQLLDFLHKPEETEKYIADRFGQASIYVRTHTTSSGDLARLVARIEGYARAHAPPGVQVTVTGETILITRAADEIAVGQVRSLAIAFLVIFAIMGLLFTSLRAGLLALVPNAVPVIGTFGLMGWLGVDLNAGTSLVASVALGIAVDDTIHYMTGFNLEMRRLGDQTRAMVATLYLRGKAIVFTSVALFCGFMVLVVSHFAPIRAFGTLTALAMLTALLGDLVILPVLLRRVDLVSLWDLLATRLPGEPGKWVGLFRGLRRGEARRVVLMCSLRRLPAGTAVLRRGIDLGARPSPVWAEEGLGRRFYAVLSGRVELWTGDGGERRPVGQVGQGDLFAETVPVPAGRPPDALAAEDTELLTIDERSLRRLARRYPATAAKVLRNLVGLFAEQLARATAQAHGPPPAGPACYDLFQGLSPRQRRRVQAEAPSRTLEAGEQVPQARHAPDALLAILEGRVVVSLQREGSEAVVVADLGPGAVFPLPGAGDLGARAAERTELLVVDRELLDRLLARSPRRAARWMLDLARILARQRDATLARSPQLDAET